MNRQCVTIGAIALSLGFVVGGIGGYRIGRDSSAKPSEATGTDGGLKTDHHLQHDIRIVEVEEHTSSMDEAFRATTIPVIAMEDNDLWELISFLQCRSAETSPISGGIHIAVGHPLIHSPELRDTRFTYTAKDVTALEVLDALKEQTGITYSIRPCAVLWGKNVDAKQIDDDLADQLNHLREPSNFETDPIEGVLPPE